MQYTIVSREYWTRAQAASPGGEGELTRRRDRLSAARRELPWVKVEKGYIFDAPEGKVTLADLFDGRSQLIVHHYVRPRLAGGLRRSLVRGRPHRRHARASRAP